MPEPDDFLRFAAVHARELVKLGHVTTGELTAGERLVEDALVEVFRSWYQLPAGDPLLAARRTLAAAGGHRRRLARPTFRGGLELRDFRATEKEQALPASALDDHQLLWEALGNLGRRQRLTLGLRYVSGLTVDEAARVLRRPAAAVRRTQRRALNELRLAADREVAVATEPGGEDALEAWVQQALQRHVDVAFDVQPLLRRLTARITHGLRPQPRRLPILAGVATLLVVGTAAVLLGTVLDDSPSQRGQAIGPPSPEGTRLVGYRTIAVAVPEDWRLKELPCGRMVAARKLYRNFEDSRQCITAGAPSVTFADAPINFAPMYAPPHRTGQVAGHVAMRNALTRVDGVYRQTVFVFGAEFMMTVRSPDRTVVDAIISSIRAVPNGFTVVPKCETLPVREAVSALNAAGLTASFAHTSSLNVKYGDPPVTFQDRDSGSVVPEGTSVALTIPSF